LALSADRSNGSVMEYELSALLDPLLRRVDAPPGKGRREDSDVVPPPALGLMCLVRTVGFAKKNHINIGRILHGAHTCWIDAYTPACSTTRHLHRVDIKLVRGESRGH
jgi:hypothetical protein